MVWVGGWPNLSNQIILTFDFGAPGFSDFRWCFPSRVKLCGISLWGVKLCGVSRCWPWYGGPMERKKLALLWGSSSSLVDSVLCDFSQPLGHLGCLSSVDISIATFLRSWHDVAISLAFMPRCLPRQGLPLLCVLKLNFNGSIKNGRDHPG